MLPALYQKGNIRQYVGASGILGPIASVWYTNSSGHHFFAEDMHASDARSYIGLYRVVRTTLGLRRSHCQNICRNFEAFDTSHIG